MKMLKYEFFGTSHGEGYGGKIWGLPKDFLIDVNAINFELKRRKCGFGRSSRQVDESPDVVEFLNFNGSTGQGFLEFFVKNGKKETRPNFSELRSGHIDLVGAVKHNTTDLRSLNEVASGRSSLCYVVLGAIAKQILAKQGIFTSSQIVQISDYVATKNGQNCQLNDVDRAKFAEIVEKARQNGDSVGGIVSIFATGVNLGQLGDFFPYENRLDGIIARHMVSIPGVKGIEFGIGRQFAEKKGSQVLDKLCANQNSQIEYATNNAGGIVAGISNGKDIYFELTVKPVPTIKNAPSIDLVSKLPTVAHFERADTCIVETVGIIAENILAAVLLDCILL